MSQEEFGATGEVLEDTELDSQVEPGTVPVVSKETEVLIDECYLGEQQLKQGEAELSETLVIKESLEAYLELIQSAGALGLTPESTEILKIGLEHIDRSGISSSLSLGMESLDSNNRFVLADNVSLEEGFKNYYKAAMERIRKIINWLVEKAHQIYTRYKEGISKLRTQLKALEKLLPKMEVREGLEFKVDNAQELMIGEEFLTGNLNPIMGLAEFTANTFPQLGKELIDKVIKALDIYSGPNSNWDLEEFNQLYDAAYDALDTISSTNPVFKEGYVLPGNLRLVYLPDRENGDQYKLVPVEGREERRITLTLQVQEPNAVKARFKLLSDIVDTLDKAAVNNLRFNESIKRVNKKVEQVAKIVQNTKDLDDEDRQTRMEPLTECVVGLKNNTPSMLGLLRYLVTKTNTYISITYLEAKLLAGE